MNRRSFLTSALVATGGLMVPEWLLDPLKGRSMITIPALGTPALGTDLIKCYVRNDILFRPKTLGFQVTTELIDSKNRKIIARTHRAIFDGGMDDWILVND